MERNKKNSAANLLLILSSMLIVFIFTEVALRILDISYPRMVQRDDNLGTVYIPGLEFWQSDEGVAYIKINSEGFRDKEGDVQKSQDVFRIALIGDSYVDAFSVPIEARFTEVLEEDFNTRCSSTGTKKVEVLNFGMSGRGTAQELLTFRHHVRKYSPDLVILAFLPYNDVRNNSRSLEKNDGIPYYVYKDSELILDNSFRDTPSHNVTFLKKLSYLMIDYSRIAQFLYRVNIIIKGSYLKKKQGRENKKDNPMEVGLDENIFYPPKDSVWKEAWRVTEGILSLAKQEILNDNAEFLLVTLTQGTVVHPSQEVRDQYLEKLGIESLYYPQDRMTEFANRNNIDILNLVEPFQNYASDNQVFLHGFSNTEMGKGHWNVEGHKLAGKLIANEVCSRFGGDEQRL